MKMCVRCGTREQTEETFLCSECLTDPTQRAEAAQAVAAVGAKGPAGRRWLVENARWHGYWGRRRV